MRTLSILGQSLLFQVAGYDLTLVFISAGIKLMAILGCFILCIRMDTLYNFPAGSSWLCTSLMERWHQLTYTPFHRLCICAKLLQSCLTLWDPMGHSSPGSSVHGILEARTLEWVAMPSSRGSSWLTGWTLSSYVSCTGRQAVYH